MRKSLIAAAALFALAAPASAADMALKAAPQSPFSTATGSGFYVGAGTEGALASSQVSGVVPGNLTASGGTVGVDAGYIWGKCILSSWCQVELDVKYQNISATNMGGSVMSRWSVSGEFDVGAEVLTTLFSYVGTLGTNFPSFNPTNLLPAAAQNTLAATPREYFGFVGSAYQIEGTAGSASGQTVSFAPGVKTGYRWQTLTAGQPNGGSLNVYVEMLFPNKGVDLTGVFAAPGGQIRTVSNNGMSQLYVAGLHYDFGVR